MALPVESFEIEAQTPNVVDQQRSVLRKAIPILLGASCLAALALFHTTGSAAGSPPGTQQLVAASTPHGNEGSVRIHAGAQVGALGLPVLQALTPERYEHVHTPHGNEGSVSVRMQSAFRAERDEDGPHMFGTERDEHGCLPTGGYVWCASRGECLQPWRTQCADLSASVHEVAREVAAWGAGHRQPAQDGDDWVYLGNGACRTASGGAGSYSVLSGAEEQAVHSIRSGVECREACSSMSACVAYELRGSDGRCELHTEAIVNVHPARGFVCWVKAQDEEAAAPSQHGLGYVPSVQALPDDLILGNPGASVLGGTRDEHNCLGSSGFTWCPSLSECVRGYSQSCPGGTETCQRLCAEEPAANEGLRFSCTCTGGVALDHVAPVLQQ